MCASVHRLQRSLFVGCLESFFAEGHRCGWPKKSQFACVSPSNESVVGFFFRVSSATFPSFDDETICSPLPKTERATSTTCERFFHVHHSVDVSEMEAANQCAGPTLKDYSMVAISGKVALGAGER